MIKKLMAIISLGLILTGCGRQFEKKYFEECSKTNLQTPSWCQCVAIKLDNSLTKEQKDILLNGANEINFSSVFGAIGAVGHATIATKSCSEQEFNENFAKLNPAEQCKETKKRALKASEEYMLNIFRGARGMSVPGHQESQSATRDVAKACGLKSYDFNDLLSESEFNGKEFILKSNPDAYKIPKLILTSELDFYRKFDHNINVCMACRSYAWYYIKEKPDSECSITIRKALDKDKISKEKLEENWWQICPQFDVITPQN